MGSTEHSCHLQKKCNAVRLVLTTVLSFLALLKSALLKIALLKSALLKTAFLKTSERSWAFSRS